MTLPYKQFRYKQQFTSGKEIVICLNLFIFTPMTMWQWH